MAFPRAYLFPIELQKTSNYFKALNYPGRLDILEFLYDNGPTKVEDIAKRFPVSKSTLSQHLKILRAAHLVNFEEITPFTFYSVNLPELHKAKIAMMAFFKHFQFSETLTTVI